MIRKFLAVLLLFVSLSVASDFCDGWRAGYIAGYCYRQQYCLPPIVPLCPLARLGEYEFDDGYNRGFLAGLNAR